MSSLYPGLVATLLACLTYVTRKPISQNSPGQYPTCDTSNLLDSSLHVLLFADLVWGQISLSIFSAIETLEHAMIKTELCRSESSDQFIFPQMVPTFDLIANALIRGG